MKHNPKYLKESPEDKQMRMVLISMISSIMVCITCLVGTTWAWFHTSITSAGNSIHIGELSVAVALIRGDQADREELTPSSQYTYRLEDVGTYSISLINSGSIPGFCTIVLTDNQGNVESFSTGTLNPAGEGLEDAATIELTVTPEDNINGILPVTLEIQPHWGEDPAYTIADIDEDVFVPTVETTEATEEPTEETTGPSTGSSEGQTGGDITTTTGPVQETTEATEEATEETTVATEETTANEGNTNNPQSRTLTPEGTESPTEQTTAVTEPENQ